MVAVTRIFDLLPHLESICNKKYDLFAFRVQQDWIYFSTADYIRHSGALSHAFRSMGLQRGERVVTIMGNRPEWNCVDMGLMLAGLIHVPVYPTLSMSTIGQILSDATPCMVIAEDPLLAENLMQLTSSSLPGTAVYSMHASSKGVRHFNEILDAGLRHFDGDVYAGTETIRPGDTATIIYTSGTTGNPKGVILSHANIVSNFLSIAPISGFGPRHRAMSFLPLCHIYERTLNYMYQYLGLSVYYVSPPERSGELIPVIRPHVFCAVPRFLEKAYSRFQETGYHLGMPQRILFIASLKLASKYGTDGTRHPWYYLRLSLARLLVFRKWKKRMGGKVEIIVSGSAPLQPRLARIFWAAGIKVLEGYGLTETSPVIAVNHARADMCRIGTVGPPLSGIDVKISEEGEILCKGPNVMKGYWNNPELTSEAIDAEGWLHTGDIGEWDAGRFLRIIDRKKELIKTSGGKYISPQQIENLFNASPYIDQIMVIGEGRHYPAAIISPDFNNLQGWCRNNNINAATPREMLNRKEVVRLLYLETEKYNQQLGRFEMIKRFLFVTESWDASTGELSPTLKLRRKMLQERYRKAIEELYEEQL